MCSNSWWPAVFSVFHVTSFFLYLFISLFLFFECFICHSYLITSGCRHLYLSVCYSRSVKLMWVSMNLFTMCLFDNVSVQWGKNRRVERSVYLDEAGFATLTFFPSKTSGVRRSRGVLTRIDVFLSADAEVNATLQSSWSLPWRQTPHIWQSCIWWANIWKTQESQCLHTIEWILMLTMTSKIKRWQQLFMPQICIQGTACNPWIMRQQNRLLYISFSCPV